MANLIDRDAAIEKLISNLTYMHTFGAARSINLIKELPSVDDIPCTFCRFSPPSMDGGKPCGLCPAEGR